MQKVKIDKKHLPEPMIYAVFNTASKLWNSRNNVVTAVTHLASACSVENTPAIVFPLGYDILLQLLVIQGV